MTAHNDSRSQRPRASVASSTNTDEYDLAAEMVSDGFRPANLPSSSTSSTPPSTSASSQQSSNSTASTQPNFASLLASRPQPEPANARPSSTAKPPRPHDSLRIQNDGDNAGEASGPSHPYNMYAQRTVSGTPPAGLGSIATAQQAQTFPLYDDDTSLPALPAEQTAPVRFGAANNFPAPMGGADSEPTEDLPPYTRYPEVSMTRKPTSQPAVSSLVPFPTSQASSTTDLTPATTHEAVEMQPQSRPRPSPTPSTVTAPQSAVVNDPGHAARSRDFSSTQDTLSVYRFRSRASTSRPSTSRPSTLSEYDEIAAMKAYPTKPPSKWQRRAQKKLCGIIPYWAICLVVVSIIIICVIMGALIGTLLRPPRGPPRKPGPPSLKPPPGLDADNINFLTVVPAGLKPMKLGQFRLSSLKFQQAAQNCVVNKTMTSAWGCDVPGWRSQVTITDNEKGTVNGYNMTFDALVKNKIWTGAQPVSLNGRTMALQLVNETIPRQTGPAWFGFQQYEKVVILEENDLKLTPTKRGLKYKLNPMAALQKRGTGHPMKDKEHGWYCSWPDAWVKIMVYPNAPKESKSDSTPTRNFGPSRTASATVSASSSVPTPDVPPFDLQYYLIDKPNCKPNSQGPPKGVSCRQFYVENSGIVFTGTPQQIDVAPDTLTKQRRDKPSITVSQCFCEWSS